MKLQLLPGALLLAAAVTSVPAAHAQIGVYLNPLVTRISNSEVDNGTFSFLGTNTKSRWFGGPVFGAYDDLYKARRFDAGIDVRDSIQHANNASLNVFSIAPRVVWKRGERLRPYAELQIGAASSKPELSDARKSKIYYGGVVGVDYRIARYIDFRAIEIGYAQLGGVSTGSFGNNGGELKNFTGFNISSGFVFRFGK